MNELLHVFSSFRSSLHILDVFAFIQLVCTYPETYLHLTLKEMVLKTCSEGREILNKQLCVS